MQCGALMIYNARVDLSVGDGVREPPNLILRFGEPRVLDVPFCEVVGVLSTTVRAVASKKAHKKKTGNCLFSTLFLSNVFAKTIFAICAFCSMPTNAPSKLFCLRFAIYTSILAFFLVSQLENVVKLLLTGADAARIFAKNYVFQLAR